MLVVGREEQEIVDGGMVLRLSTSHSHSQDSLQTSRTRYVPHARGWYDESFVCYRSQAVCARSKVVWSRLLASSTGRKATWTWLIYPC